MGHSASLSRWERDRGLLRTLVNVGELSAAETRFPREEVYEAATDGAIARVLVGEPMHYRRNDPALDVHGRRLLDFSAKDSAVSLPVWVDDRLWGELWVSRDDELLGPTRWPPARRSPPRWRAWSPSPSACSGWPAWRSRTR